MSFWSRVVNVVRGERLTREINDELQAHIDEAIESGRDPAEVRRAFGPLLATREEIRDIRVVPWLESLKADIAFGWRQLFKSKVTTAAAVLSLGLAIGACTAAFRLVDAVLMRPLPIAHPERLFSLTKHGMHADRRPMAGRAFDYPLFLELREAASPDAEFLAVSFSRPTDLTYGSSHEMEKAYAQYVSGWIFDAFGLHAAIGRLLTANDDRIPQAHPHAVLSHAYWRARFGEDPEVVGKTFVLDKRAYEIVGVVERGFTGTEPGTMTDVFVPTMMHPLVERSGATWFQALALLEGEAGTDSLLARLEVIFSAYLDDRAKDFRGRGLRASQLDSLLSQRLRLEPASAGASPMQEQYREALIVLSVLVGLVLMIACTNVANLMTARASSRAREMALRVAIGAGRRRLVQLVLVESALITVAAATIGGALAWWAAPAIVSAINLPAGPARLALPMDWRLLGFVSGLTLVVTIIFGLAPALRASATQPIEALKGGGDVRSRTPMMGGLVGAQVAFCFVVLFVGGLFVATFDRLAGQPVGFSAERLLAVETVAVQPQTAVNWRQVAEHLRTVPGVESVSLAAWPLMGGSAQSVPIAVDGGPLSDQPSYMLGVTPGWIDTMKIPLLAGRDLRDDEIHPSAALVNEEFVKEFFDGQSPIGKSFELPIGRALGQVEIVGLVGNAKYDSIREPFHPTMYVPFGMIDGKGGAREYRRAAFLVRTSNQNPRALADALRLAAVEARPGFYVSNLTPQRELNDSQIVRERLLAMLAFFFVALALVLSAVGIYGVLHYSIVQRHREIGICIALGAQSVEVVRRVTATTFWSVLLGSAAGLAVGTAIERYVGDLLWGVDGTDPAMLLVPALLIVTVLLAAAPAVLRAVRIDPAKLLRAE